MSAPAPVATARGAPGLPGTIVRRRCLESWAAAAFACLAAAAFLLCGAIEPLEHRLTEVRAGLLDRAPTGEVVIVEVDARSLAALNSWPWSRRYHAALINRLGAAGAAMIAFDVDFSARSDPAGDVALARVLDKVQPVILPVFQQRASDSPGAQPVIKSRPAAPFATAWVGGVNIIPGHDGVVRDFPAATMIGGQIQPAMAVLLSDNGRLGDRTFIPDWSIDARRIPRLSFIDVLNGRAPRSAIAGKRIIVGATAIELGDRYTIPRFGTVPGVVVQALAAETLLQHRALKRSGTLPTLIGFLLVGLVLARPYRRFGRTFPPAAAALLSALLLVPVATQFRWPVSVDTAALLVAVIAGVVLRVIVEIRHLSRVAAIRDADTGLPNQHALATAIDEAEQHGLTLTAAAIERFEAIRGAVSSADVTQLVAQAATRIEQALGSPVYRIAPDTLAWLTPVEGDAESSIALVSERFGRPIESSTAAIDISLTCGIAAMTGDINSGQLIERALSAVTEARAGGRQRQWFYGVAPNALRDLSIMGDLRRGLEEGQLFVAYQPKLHLKSGNIANAEALVRWRHPVEGLIPPDRFLPLAEETGMVREITRFVLGRAIDECLRTGSPETPLAVSVNVSAADLSRPGFADEVIGMLTDAKTDPTRLTLEITESAIIRSRQTALEVLITLRDFGVRLSIDDYGTGQSTLSYLKTLPVDELKIDKMFVTRLGENEGDRIMVQSTIDLAHRLGLAVVAEGAEDWETVRILADLGCDYVQGYVVGRGMTLAELHALANTTLRRAA